MTDYFIQLEALHPKDLIRIYEDKSHAPLHCVWEFTDEFKPLDLYCYLHAKYGAPNGIQNFLRNDDSDNLIHWEWSLVNEDGLITIQGHNFRTEVQLFRKLGVRETKENFVTQVKADFSGYGKAMKDVRMQLEKWTHFVNPYYRTQSVLDRHINELVELDLDVQRDSAPHPNTVEGMQIFADSWQPLAEKYTRALGIAFGVRAMLPVLAESFVNFVIFALARPEIRNSKRLLAEALRRPIDVRVQMLHLSCIGFNEPVNYEHPACAEFHTLMNERNDILHGNIDLDRLSFEDIYFKGRVPIFTSYGSIWDKTIGLEAKTVRLAEIQQDRKSVESFKDYIVSLLGDRTKDSIERMLRTPHLGFDGKRKILGVLLPTHIVESRAGPPLPTA